MGKNRLLYSVGLLCFTYLVIIMEYFLIQIFINSTNIPIEDFELNIKNIAIFFLLYMSFFLNIFLIVFILDYLEITNNTSKEIDDKDINLK